MGAFDSIRKKGGTETMILESYLGIFLLGVLAGFSLHLWIKEEE